MKDTVTSVHPNVELACSKSVTQLTLMAEVIAALPATRLQVADVVGIVTTTAGRILRRAEGLGLAHISHYSTERCSTGARFPAIWAKGSAPSGQVARPLKPAALTRAEIYQANKARAVDPDHDPVRRYRVDSSLGDFTPRRDPFTCMLFGDYKPDLSLKAV